MKPLILLMLLIFMMMENATAKNASTQNDLTIKKVITKQVKQLLTINETDIKVSPVETLLTSLPDRYKYYQAQDKSRCDYNIICSYISVDKELFSSCEKKDFARFLKHEKFVEKSFTASQFVSLFEFMHSKSFEFNIVNPPEHVNDKVKDLLWLTDFDKHQNKWPQMKKTDDGIEVIFWASNASSNVWQKSTVKVSKDYKVTREIEEKSADN